MTTKLAALALEQPNPELVPYIEEILERAKRGEITAIATVEVERGGYVASGLCNDGKSYHALNSGAARLSARLATEETK